MKKKILIIGLGSAGNQHLRNLLNLDSTFNIGILRKNKNKPNISRVKFFYQITDAQKFKPDAIIISSPASTHLHYLKKFHNLCNNFLIEKPLSNEFNEYKFLYNSKKLVKKNILIGYQLKFHPLLIFLKKILLSKKYGKINHVNINTGQYLPHWRKIHYTKSVSSKKELGGGALMELSHEIDYALWIFGVPEKIYSNFKKVSDLKINAEDIVDIIMDYKKYNLNVHLDFINRISKREIIILTSRGSIMANLISGTISFYDGKNKKQIFKIKNKKINLKKVELDIFLKKSFKNYQSFTRNKNYEKSISNFQNSFNTMNILNKIRLSDYKKKLISVKKS